MTEKNIYKDILFGVAVGDALGVPVEFDSRQEISQNPVTDMIGFGTYDLPAGTFSDDSSLAFCLAEALTQEFSLQKIGNNFVAWLNNNYWTPRGNVFDVGIATSQAIRRLQRGCNPELAGGMDVSDNGNGSLMRILPMAYCHRNFTLGELLARVHDVSAITHAHARSQMACGIYISIAVALLEGADLQTAYLQALQDIQTIYSVREFLLEKPHFGRVFSGEIAKIPVEEINSGGYVIDTLESSLWCLLNSSSYSEAVLKAVNLGGDTDTTAAVTGGLAGIYYGVENIPKQWMNQIARRQDIIYLAERFKRAVYA